MPEDKPITTKDGLGSIHLSRAEESYHLLLKPGATRATRREALELIDNLGLECMPDDECPADVLKDSSIRVWLAQKAGA